jgi:transglutaminase-like putative cysteine protease
MKVSATPRTRGLRAVLVVGAFLFGVPAVGGWAAQAKERRELRYGVYLLGSRIGESTVKQSPTQFKGRSATRIDSKTTIKIVVMGEVSQQIDLTHILDERATPLFLTMKMASSGNVTTVAASFFPDRVECTIDSQGTKSKKVVPIPKGVSLVADPQMVGEKAGKGKKLKPGTKLRVHFFEPMTLQILPLDLEVLREEPIEIDGKKVGATVVKTTNPISGESTDWLADDGTLLQEENRLGMRLVQEAKAPATVAGAYQPPVDFLLATSVKTTTQIQEPRAVKYLRVRISGIPEARFVLRDARQQAQIEPGAAPLTADYEVTAAVPDDAERPNTAVPASPRPRGSASQPFLAPAPYLEVDDPRIRKQAAEIAAGEKDALIIARRVRAWVHGHMKAQTNIGVIRSATNVLESGEGVCRDYATLFAALARAAGVPTRLCAGIVFFKEGFYYHAWNECRVGGPDGPWVPFDSTLPDDFVDATHIKFSEGDPTSMFQAVRVVGQLKAEILEYR